MKTTRIAVTGLASLSLAAPAAAMHPAGDGGTPTAKGRVDVAEGHRLSVRRRPTTGARVVRRLKDGARVVISCQATGATVTGTFGTTSTWDKLARGGYVSDAYVYTGTDGRVAPDCPTTSAPAPTGQPASITLRNDYPYASDSPNEVDPWGFYKRECTSFVASRLNKVMTFSNRMRGGHFGNAENWDENARALGFKVNHHPRVGSVMVRNSGTYGHVAMVAKVGKGRVFVEQYNAGGTHDYSQQWLDVASSMDFIHFVKGQ
jgi:surface antigen